MSDKEFNQLPDSARTWVFASSAPLSQESEDILLSETDTFLKRWHSHGDSLVCSRDWKHGRFLCVAVNQESIGASGCSTDGLFRFVRRMETELAISLMPASLVYWRNEDSSIDCADRHGFKALVAQGKLVSTTPVFDTSIQTAGEWRSSFELPLQSSWHSRLIT